ncbi:MAG: RDD family protein [Betaproteobacteria bacterium]|nr:RDD family protein [Betaproteobacteria bacterium]
MKSAAGAPRPNLASIRRRLAGILYEALLLVGVLALTFLVPHLILGAIWQVSVPGWAAWLHIFVVLGAYFTWYWCRGGQTLAMQTWRMRVVDAASGRAPSLHQALLRYCLSWPSLLFGGAGLVWALFDPERQFLHDRLAGTRIVDCGKGG